MTQVTDNDAVIRAAYRKYGRWSIGRDVNQIDPEGYAYWLGVLNSGKLTVEQFNAEFDKAVATMIAEQPTNPYSIYTKAYGPGGGKWEEYYEETMKRLGQ